MLINKRKKEHLEIIRKKNTSSNSTTCFEDIMLIPKSLPELNFEDIDSSITFLGKKLSAPILISSMTGGTEEAKKINQLLANAAEKHKIAFSVGSQKAMIKFPDLTPTYQVRDIAPDILLIGNIGIDYLLSDEFNYKKLENAVKKIGADALFVHINPLQEIVQIEGTTRFKGALSKIKEICSKLDIPVLAKEVGDGINPETAVGLEKAGIKAIDVAGLGGTSWLAVERFRGSPVGESFRDWGLPTALSLLAVKRKTNLPLISSGGIRNGYEIAKSIALGADLVGLAKPFAMAVFQGEKALDNLIDKLIIELKMTMLLVGASNIEELKKSKYLIRGELKELLEQI